MAVIPTTLPTPTEFMAGAQPLTLTITKADGTVVASGTLEPKHFGKPGDAQRGYGWFGQVMATIAGLRVNGGLSLSVSKSKEAPQTREPAPADAHAANGTGS